MYARNYLHLNPIHSYHNLHHPLSQHYELKQLEFIRFMDMFFGHLTIVLNLLIAIRISGINLRFVIKFL